MSSPVAFVKNTFLNFADEEQVREMRRLSPSKTIDLGCLKNETFMLESDSESTAYCSSLSNLSTMSIADSEDSYQNLDVAKVQMAAAHACGECKPCAFAMKKGGCKNDECGFCHEEHSKDFLKFIRKRNRALRMAEIYGDEPRCAETYQQFSQERRRCC